MSSAVLTACLLLALPVALHAQRSATYLYLRGTDTLGVETITLNDTLVRGDLVLTGAPRMLWTHRLLPGAFGALGMRVFAPNSAANAAPAQEGTLRIDGDSARIEFSAGTRTQKQSLHTKAGAVALVNASVLHAALIGIRAIAAGKQSVDLFLSNGGQTSTGSFAKRGDTLVMNIAGAESRAVLDADGLPSEVAIPSQSARVVRSAMVGPAGAPLIDYGAPPNAPYIAEQVTIPTGRGYSLAGTLTVPVGSRAAPVVITISGSGPQERDSRLAVVPGYALFREIADTLARRGIATLRYDDRGVGASGGIESARTGTSLDFAEDVQSVIAFLKRLPSINASRIALAGHSEGGMIAPMVAASSPDVHAIALLAGSAYPGRTIIMGQNRESIDAMSITPAQRDSIWKTVPVQLDAMAAANPWLRLFMSHDPIATAKQVKVPVLIMQGDTDHQVTPEQADSLSAAFRAGGNTRVTVRHFPNTNHLFLHDVSGAFTGYPALKDARIPRAVLGALADWMANELR